METKICSKCECEKPLNEFHKLSKAQDGLQYKCKDCGKAWAHAHQEQRRISHRKWYKEKNVGARKNRWTKTPHGRYLRCRSTAKTRGLEFTLSEPEFTHLIEEGCYYCNGSASGLDRVDNTLGYIATNIVPCCYQCNSMKMDWSQEEFIQRCKEIAAKH